MSDYLVKFATTHNITPAQAVVLPALFDKCATELKMSPREIYCASLENAKIGEYIAEVARNVGDEYIKRAPSK